MAHVNYSSLPDTEVFMLMKGADHSAYTEIYSRYFELIFCHALKKLRDEEVAKDVVQEVFANLWLKRLSISVESNLAGYLFTAARNRVFNFWAHEDIESRYWNSLATAEPLEKYSSVETDYKIREQQLLEYIERQVSELPPRMRTIFELSRKQYLTHREIAEQLSTSEGNVSKQIGNALKILRAKLGAIIYLLILLVIWLIIIVGSYFKLSFYSLIQLIFNF